MDSTSAGRPLGWLGVVLIAVAYLALYLYNLWLPLPGGHYATRIWDWTQAALVVGAVVVLILRWRSIEWRLALVGLGLGALTALSQSLRDPGLLGMALEGAAVWVTFVAGSVLCKPLGASGPTAFQPPLSRIGRSLVVGLALGVPLAVVNNLYFYLNAGAVRFQDVAYSAVEALRPAISEEAVFRYFVLAVCLTLLQSSAPPRLRLGAALALAVIPHSLNHLPDLFLANAPMACFMLVATSLLFGLPMALLQVRRGFESAVAFHWLIDFARFLFGY
jgi:hypothetical protein